MAIILEQQKKGCRVELSQDISIGDICIKCGMTS